MGEPGSGAGFRYPGGSGFQRFSTRVGLGCKVLPPGWVRVSKFCYPGESSLRRNGAANCQLPGHPGYPGTGSRPWQKLHCTASPCQVTRNLALHSHCVHRKGKPSSSSKEEIILTSLRTAKLLYCNLVFADNPVFAALVQKKLNCTA